ncbi:hypothetical protein H0H93_000282 [Arthromyces matolae]|nr:hypothetical protein H0H93_000282 [Arthromyces matolae]
MAAVGIPSGPEAPVKDLEATLAAFDNIPLFMKSLPTDDTEDSSLAALQSLVHDGTPDEVAQNFKEQGNEYFQGKRYREALGFYTQGLDATPTDIVLREALLCNRAACNLELKNYGSVLRDCSAALTLNETSSKAFYRSALALLALDRAEEALDCCDRCLAFDPENKGVGQVRERAGKAKTLRDQRKKAKAERLHKEAEAKRQLDNAFRQRNLIILPKADGSSNPYEPHFDPDDPTNNTLVFPVFFLYPQYATSDVISEFVEGVPFAAHLEQMFPPQAPAPDWDKRGEYIADQLVVYAMTHRKRLLKVGKKMTLSDVFPSSRAKEGEKRDGLELKDGCLTFVVLPKGEVEKKWVEDYKKSREE